MRSASVRRGRCSLVVAVCPWTITPYASLMPVYARTCTAAARNAGDAPFRRRRGGLTWTRYLAGRPASRPRARDRRGDGAPRPGHCGVLLPAHPPVRVGPDGARRWRRDSRGGVGQHDPADDRRGSVRGRIASYFSMVFLGVAPLGNLAAGALAAGVRRRRRRSRCNGARSARVDRSAGSGVGCPASRSILRPTYVKLGIIAD